MKNRAQLWLEENRHVANKMLAGKFAAKEVGITKIVKKLHSFGYIRKIESLSGDRSIWEATTKMKDAMKRRNFWKN